jgi:hypothetical protein
MEYEHGAVFHG